MSTSNKMEFKDELLDLLYKQGTLKTFTPGQSIIPDDSMRNKVIFLIQGSLKVFIKCNTKKVFLYHLNGNELHFSQSLHEHSHLSLCAQVIEESTMGCIPTLDFMNWVNERPQFRNFMIAYQQEKYTTLLNAIKTTIEQPLKVRILDYLKSKSIQYNSNHIPITKNEIAIDLNTSRKSIYRAIRELEAEKKIAQKTRCVILLT